MSTANAQVPLIRLPWAGILSSIATSLRFSLRELFLVTVVCAAAAAWWHEVREQQRPLTPSHVADYFRTGLQQDVAAARAEIGEIGTAWQMEPFPGMDQRGLWKIEHTLSRDWFGFLNLDREKARTFRDALERKVFSNIRQGEVGEHISTSEYESEIVVDSPAIFGRSVKYHCGATHGTLRVYIVPTDGKHVQVIANLNEWRVP